MCGLLGACLLTQFSFVYIASSDPSAVAEPDYYAKALRWEDRQRQERINTELGWQGDVELGPQEQNGVRRVRLRLETASGGPGGLPPGPGGALPQGQGREGLSRDAGSDRDPWGV